MPDLRSEPAPVSEAVTEDIRVEVLSQYSPENSRPAEGEWVFQYTVRITNLGRETVQLVSRHWIITDGFERIEEVRGPGVVGAQPVLAPGVMRGEYQMTSTDGRRFDIEIAPFALKSRYTVH
jgi:ApaG protein